MMNDECVMMNDVRPFGRRIHHSSLRIHHSSFPFVQHQHRYHRPYNHPFGLAGID